MNINNCTKDKRCNTCEYAVLLGKNRINDNIYGCKKQGKCIKSNK